MPYPLVEVYDDVSRQMAETPLPSDFSENRYYILRNRIMVAAVDADFRDNEGLVNFSFVMKPPEIFKKKAAMSTFKHHVVPYMRERTGSDDWIWLMPGQFMLLDKNRSLAIQAKFYFAGPMKSFGLAVMDRKYSGL